jgi:hypothetical protein
VTSICAAILVLHIIFVLFEASPRNGVVRHVADYARTLAGPFRTLFTFKTSQYRVNVKLTVGINYGLAALAYVVGGHLVGFGLHKISVKRP